jgi:hypothetical protein
MVIQILGHGFTPPVFSAGGLPLVEIGLSVVLVFAPLLVVLALVVMVPMAITTSANRRRAASAGSPVAAATILAAGRATITHAVAWVAALLAGAALPAIGMIVGPMTVPGRYADYAPEPDWMNVWNPAPLALAPAGIALAYLAVLLAGEATWRTSDGVVRRAGLAARTTSTVAPALLRHATWAWSALLVATAVVAGLTATRTGALQRSVAAPRAGRDDLVELLTAAPYPSWEAGVPLAAGALAVVLGVELVLRRVTTRPAIDGVDPAWDLALRRLTARRVLRLPQLVTGLVLCAVLCWLGGALLTVALPAPGWALVTLGIAAGVTALALAVTPGSPLPRPEPELAPAPQPLTTPRTA